MRFQIQAIVVDLYSGLLSTPRHDMNSINDDLF